jgi:hypothetical protein
MLPIVIPFPKNGLGRVEFRAHVMTGDRKSLKGVDFKYDSGSDFTTLSCDDLDRLGYARDYLESCPHHEGGATLAIGIADGNPRTGSVIGFTAVIVSASALMISRKRKRSRAKES